MPVGAVPTHAPLNDTVSAVPEITATEIVDVRVSLRASVRLSGDAVTEKSNGTPSDIDNVTLTVRSKPPPVPVTRYVKVPVLAVAVVEKVKALLNVGVPDEGEKLHVTPPGAVPIQSPVSETVSAVPETSVTVTVVETGLPRCTTSEVADALIEKSNVGGVYVTSIGIQSRKVVPCAPTLT
jgi:hypothetical protein